MLRRPLDLEREGLTMVVQWYPVWLGWAVLRWEYGGRASWRHGTAYLGRLKIIW